MAEKSVLKEQGVRKCPSAFHPGWCHWSHALLILISWSEQHGQFASLSSLRPSASPPQESSCLPSPWRFILGSCLGWQHLRVPWPTPVPISVLPGSRRQDKTRERGNILFLAWRKTCLESFFRFQEYCSVGRILFFQRKNFSAYYRTHFIRRSQNTFQTKLTSLPDFHETLIVGGIYLQ